MRGTAMQRLPYVLLIGGLLCAAVADARTDKDGPQHRNTIILVNNIRYGHHDNCVVDLSRASTGTVVCGRSGAVSEITYSFIDRKGENDVWKITRTFPLGEPSASTVEKTVSYHGMEIFFLRDDQNFFIRPR
jgi:hypothetical protein